MGLTKQYLRYAAAGVFGVVGSSRANVVLFEYQGTAGRLAAVAACEHVFIWDLKTGDKVLTLEGDQHEATVLARSPNKRHLAVGYANGAIKLFNLSTGQAEVAFSGHKSAVTALNYDKSGMRLVSGSSDTEIILWDIVNESGLYRLRGHKGMITQARFLSTKNVLITSSKDTFIKFWDLDTEHCFRTLVGHKTEVWDFVVDGEENLLVTGSGDSEIRTWKLLYDVEAPAENPKRARLGSDDEDDDDEDVSDESSSMISCSLLGSVLRQGKDRVFSMTTDQDGQYLGCHGKDNQIEIFRINTEQEAKKHQQKKLKKVRKRQQEDTELMDGKLKCEDFLRRIATVKCTSKVRAIACITDSEVLKFVGLMVNNSLETCSVDVKQKEVISQNKLSMPGHRSDVRTVAFSSDNTAIMSGSGEEVKVWNRATLQCIRTLRCDYALTCLFAPGDRHVVIGTQSGKLQIFDIAAAAMLEAVEAHTGAVWSVSMAPDKKGLISGSADHTVKFWDFELVTDEEFSSSTKRLTLIHTRTLKMAEDVLCVKYSPDKRLIAVSLLDNTVKVFFADTLKFFLSLYGHKLPVLCMDISSDSNLIITGSADRNIKLWGLDFGDCHKSIFAHDDSIMCLQFIPKTHMFFSGGKDRKVKQWNGDNYDHIITLEGHKGELWCLAVSPSGNFVVTGSHDKSLRLWEKTQEPLVLEEEREMEREKEYEKSAEGGETVIAGETAGETARAGKKTIETVKSAERIMEALELYKIETQKLAKHAEDCKAAGRTLPPPVPDPMMQAFNVTTPLAYVLMVLRKVKSSELEEALLVLPISYIWTLLPILEELLRMRQEVELVSRCLLFLLKIHQGHITSSHTGLPLLENLATTTDQVISGVRDTVGYNLAGLRFLKQQLESKEEMFFLDATKRRADKRKKAKKAAILTLKL